MKRIHCLLLSAALALAVAPGALAVDGSAGGPPTYYEQAMAQQPARQLASPVRGLPQQLHVVDADGRALYRQLEASEGRSQWELRLEVAERNHERVDAVYDLVLAVPMPVDTKGWDAFQADGAVQVREETREGDVPMVYDGRELVLERNRALEEAWLSMLQERGQLPDLSGTGYAYTLWDAVVARDPLRGSRVEGHAVLRYSTADGVAAPDASDARNAAFLVTWIPELDASVEPWTIKLDVADGGN